MPDTFPHEDVRSGVIPKKKGDGIRRGQRKSAPDDFGKVKDSPKKTLSQKKKKRQSIKNCENAKG